MRDPIEQLESFYEGCRSAEPVPVMRRTENASWLGIAAALALGAAATIVVALATPKPRTNEAAAAQWLQQSQLARQEPKEAQPWRG